MTSRPRFGLLSLAVLTCKHVADGKKKVTYVGRYQDGDWMFHCGGVHDDLDEDLVVVGIEHLVGAQPELHSIANLEPGWVAEINADGQWMRSEGVIMA